jgi:ribosome-associated toxin RatA of RatAB toxin-antitoxin module
MKRIDGRASAVVAAPLQTCYQLLEAVHRYPSWNQYVREVEVLEWAAEDRPGRARAHVHVAQSPFGKDFHVVLGVYPQPPLAVRLSRLDSERDRLELCWHLDDRAPGAQIELEFHATASFLPGWLPLFGVGDLIARTLVEAARVTLTERGLV